MNDCRRALEEASQRPLTLHEDGGASQRFLFDQDFPAFQGHFPGQPVLPAVIQIMAGESVLAALLGRKILLTSVRDAKFFLPLGPGSLVDVFAAVDNPAVTTGLAPVAEDALADRPAATTGGTGRCRVRLSVDGQLASSFILVFEREET